MLLRRASSSGDQLLFMIEWFSVVRPLSVLGNSVFGRFNAQMGFRSKLRAFSRKAAPGKQGEAKSNAVRDACFVMSLRTCIKPLKGVLVP